MYIKKNFNYVAIGKSSEPGRGQISCSFTSLYDCEKYLKKMYNENIYNGAYTRFIISIEDEARIAIRPLFEFQIKDGKFIERML